MGVSGVFGLFTSRLIIKHFGTDAYAQYGLLASFPTLLPFADLGIAAVVINAVAGPRTRAPTDGDARTIITAFRILIVAGSIMIGVAALISLLGLWPVLLGEGLTAGGSWPRPSPAWPSSVSSCLSPSGSASSSGCTGPPARSPRRPWSPRSCSPRVAAIVLLDLPPGTTWPR